MGKRTVILVIAGVVAVLAGVVTGFLLVQARDGGQEPQARPGTAPPAATPTHDATAPAAGSAGESVDDDPTPAGRNLLTPDQHTFTTSIQGWTAQGNTTLDRDTSVSLDDGASLAVAVDEAGPWPDATRTARAGTSHEPGQGVAVEPGASYRASWQVHSPAEAPARCELRWYAPDGQILDTVEGSGVTTAANSWTEASCGGTAPDGTGYASVRVFLAEVDYGMVFHVDDVWLVGAPASGTAAVEPSDPEETPTQAPAATEPEQPVAREDFEPVPGSGDDPRHGEDVGAGNTGPTAYFDEELGRALTYGDLEPSGPITTTHDGQVIERKDVAGQILIAHADVVIRGVRIRNQGDSRYSVSYDPDSPSSGADISYVEIDGNDDPDNMGVNLWDFTLRHAHIYGQSTGVNFGSNSTIEYSYVHSQALKPGSHNTAMSMHGGSGARVRFNNLVGSTSSSLSLYPRVSPLVDIVVEGNLFNGGAYCTYAGGGSKEYAPDSRAIRFVGNKFGRDVHPDCGLYGPVTNLEDRPGNVWQDNTWQDSGEAVR